MKYDAIIFDLFGTLVDNFTTDEFEPVLTEMAAIINAPAPDFMQQWSVETWPLRAAGAFPTLEATIEHICRALSVEVEQEQLSVAAALRFEFTRRKLVPRHDTIETLTLLKSSGYKIGLISDCTVEVPLLWPDTALAPRVDVPIFSCSVALKKPDPRIYLLACERLEVLPSNCLYLGDGGSQELSGAMKVGMHPILIQVPYENTYDASRHEAKMWSGPRVSTVKDVLAFVDDTLVEKC